MRSCPSTSRPRVLLPLLLSCAHLFFAITSFRPGVVNYLPIMMKSQRQHQYAEVRKQDQHHDDDSSTEVESLVGGEKHWASNDYHNRSYRSKRRTCWQRSLGAMRWFTVIALQIVIIGLLARDQGLLMDSKWGRSARTSENEVGGDVTGWGPHSEYSCEDTILRDTNGPSPNPPHKVRDQPDVRTI
jgi:hypothetical protein